MTLHARMFSGDEDARLLAHVASRATLVAPRCSYWHVGDVWWGMYQNTVFDPHSNIRLWFDGAEPVGFAWFDPRGSVATQVVPERADWADLEAEMLAWAEERRRAAPVPVPEGPLTLTAMAFEHDARRIALLTERGYARVGTPLYHFQRPLSGAPVPASPGNITVHAVGEEPEWAARVDLHREVWHPSKVTLEAYRRLRASPGYRRELDLVGMTSDGTFASYCICWFDPATRTGEFEPVGTRPAFRRQGFARAVLVEGLRRLWEHGATQAIVYTPHTNTGARALYESVGFRIVGSEYDYTKTLRDTGEASGDRFPVQGR